MNPYNFTRMEWWTNKNKDGLGYACVGFCENGDVYMTFDVRRRKNGLYFPVFSPICRIGSKGGHRKEAYTQYRELFGKLEGYDILPAEVVPYQILHDKHLYKFEI